MREDLNKESSELDEEMKRIREEQENAGGEGGEEEEEGEGESEEFVNFYNLN